VSANREPPTEPCDEACGRVLANQADRIATLAAALRQISDKYSHDGVDNCAGCVARAALRHSR